MMRILNAEPHDYSDKARGILLSLGELHEEQLTRNGLLACISKYDVLIVRLGFQVDQELINAGNRLKYIVSATTGLDHIDLDNALAKGIKVISLTGHVEFLKTVRATAELTVGLALALLRNIPGAVACVHKGIWNRDLFRGRELYGKTAGIVGMGRLGTIVAQYFRQFGMKVLGYDPRMDFPFEAAEQVVTLHHLLDQSDLISLHVTYSESTKHLIGPDEFAAMKKGAVFINTSRGGIIDEDALLAALSTGRLAGAALDVLGEEPHVTRFNRVVKYARKHSNLLVVPHIGGNTYESLSRAELFIAEKLQEALKSER